MPYGNSVTTCFGRSLVNIEIEFMKEYQYHIFSPYRVCPLGAHVDHQHGLVTGFAIDKGVDLWFNVNDEPSQRSKVYWSRSFGVENV